jgi:HEPN domain-containing protein
MNGTAREWLDKAEGDYRTASRELQTEESPNFDAVCYHAQQCIEKIMKALLIHHAVVPPRTHNLVELNELLQPFLPGWKCKEEDLRHLTHAAVAFRYPTEFADQEEANEAFSICRRLRAFLLELAFPRTRALNEDESFLGDGI